MLHIKITLTYEWKAGFLMPHHCLSLFLLCYATYSLHFETGESQMYPKISWSAHSIACSTHTHTHKNMSHSCSRPLRRLHSNTSDFYSRENVRRLLGRLFPARLPHVHTDSYVCGLPKGHRFQVRYKNSRRNVLIREKTYFVFLFHRIWSNLLHSFYVTLRTSSLQMKKFRGAFEALVSDGVVDPKKQVKSNFLFKKS